MTGSETPSRTPLKVVIVGGGYAGLTALITLRKEAPDTEITLIDPRSSHLIVTKLHETVHRPLDSIEIPYTTLAKRFGFRHIQQSIVIDEASLECWQRERSLSLDNETIPFDYLLIAIGARPTVSLDRPNRYDLSALTVYSCAEILERHIAANSGVSVINLVGAGSTGLQFAFEVDHVLKTLHADFRLSLFDAKPKLLGTFPLAISGYVEQRLIEKRIAWIPEYVFKGSDDQTVLLENPRGERRLLPDNELTLVLTGKKPELLLHANSSGQVTLNRKTLTRIFTAGDCSHYDRIGSNSMTAQSAIRKGRAAAKNILLDAKRIRFCLPYMHSDIGYVLSLGPSDAVGWVGTKSHVVKGLAAYLIKETTDSQYDLLLTGIDSYVV